MSRNFRARDVAFAGAFDLDDVGAEPRQELRARRARLHVREVEDGDAVQCLAHHVPLCDAVIPKALLRLPMAVTVSSSRRG
jgi:hypothetical protein